MSRYKSLYDIQRVLDHLDSREDITADEHNTLQAIRDILARPDEPEPDTCYNGWTNYPTWRIHLELLRDYCDSLESDRQTFASAYKLADHLKVYTEDLLSGEMTGETGNDLAISYALAFIDDVNYDEIAEHYPDLIESDDDDDDDDEGDA